MRRLFMPAALLAAIAALVWLSGAWSERAKPRRATEEDTGDGAVSGEVAAASEPTRAASQGDAAASESGALVKGTVTGPQGPLWIARVVAYRAGGAVMAETWTNPEGLYSLAVEPETEFLLAVEPAPETGLLPERRGGMLLANGEEREENAAMKEGASLRGQLVDAAGNGARGVELLAVRPEDLDADPAELAAVAAARIRCGQQGHFRLRPLMPGSYALVVTDPDWMFASPVMARTDGPDLSLAVVPALTIDLRVRNIETDQPVPAFTVRARLPDRVLLEGTGTDGVFAKRIPYPGTRERLHASLEVSAPGFAPAEGPTRRQELWLIPRRDPNTTVRVFFGKDDPYVGDLSVNFRAKAHAAASHVRFERVKDGVFRAALPRGTWDLTFVLPGYFGEEAFEVPAEVRGGVETELSLAPVAGGTIVFTLSPGTEPCRGWVRSVDDERRGRMGRAVTIPRDGARVQGIPPGSYRIGYEPIGGGRPASFSGEVRVDIGTVEQVTAPSD